MFVSNVPSHSQLLWTAAQDTDNQQKENTIALFKAIESKDVEEAIRLIETGAKMDIAQDMDVELLFQAIDHDRPDLVQLLIKNGARINAEKDGFTPLMAAILNHNQEMVALLIDKCGADVNLGSDLHIPLVYALQLSKPNPDMVQLLIDKGANVNIANELFSPLLFAVGLNKPDMVQLLIDSHANVDMAMKDGTAPLHKAIMQERPAIVQLLLDSRANVNIAMNDGKTPLHCVAKGKRPEIIQILLGAKADINAYDDNGDAAVHRACANRCASIVKMLFVNGAVWTVPTGYEAGEMKFLAAAWGIGGRANINGKMVGREGASGRKPELWVMGDALQPYLPEIAAAFNADKDLDPRKRLGKIQSGALVVVGTGWDTHAITLVFYKGYLAICNRGAGGPTRVYRIDVSKLTKGLLKEINELASGDKETATRLLYTELPHTLRATQRDPICRALNHGQRHLKNQKHGFCAYDSPEAALYVSLALKALRAGGNLREVRSTYKFYTTHFRFQFLHEYLNQIESGRIKKEGMDIDLLWEIRDRLQNPKWHPERFANPPFDTARGSSLERLERVSLACYFAK